MKSAEIQVGQKYMAKISGRIVPVLVQQIREAFKGYGGKDRFGFAKSKTGTVYDVLNTVTGRTTTFRSAAKFRRPVAELPVAFQRPLSELPAVIR